MIFNSNEILYWLDLLGITASSAAATLLAKRLRFDVLGVVLTSVAGSVGGGTLRDLLLNRHPVFWLVKLEYLFLITFVSIFVQIFFYKLESKLNKPLRWFDAIGLATFTIIGSQIALAKQMSIPIAILMGVITATFGGIVRDVICRKLPLVLHQEIYISASMLGGIIYVSLLKLNVGESVSALCGMLVVIILRMLSVYRGWQLPNISIMFKN